MTETPTAPASAYDHLARAVNAQAELEARVRGDDYLDGPLPVPSPVAPVAAATPTPKRKPRKR